MYLGMGLGKYENFGLDTFSVPRVFILGMVTPEDLIPLLENTPKVLAKGIDTG